MKIDNALTLEYLRSYPSQAARVLDHISTDDIVELFREFPAKTCAAVIAAMMPAKATQCLDAMERTSAGEILNELPTSALHQIFRLISPDQHQQWLQSLSNKTAKEIVKRSVYATNSVGLLLEPYQEVLPNNITVADASRRVNRSAHKPACHIFIVNESFKLVGMIDLGTLLNANRRAQLRDVMNQKTHSLSVRANLESVIDHPGWAIMTKLPVVERDNTFLGVISYDQLRQQMLKTKESMTSDSLDGLLSLGELYWTSAMELMTYSLGDEIADKKEKQK